MPTMSAIRARVCLREIWSVLLIVYLASCVVSTDLMVDYAVINIHSFFYLFFKVL